MGSARGCSRRCGSRAGGATAGASMSKEKTLPRSGWLSTWIRPPMASTSFREMVSPRPVPPWRRDIEPSACRKASKINSCCSPGIPMPVSATANRSRPPLMPGSQVYAAFGREFDRVAGQVDQHLPQPGVVGHHPLGRGLLHHARQRQPLPRCLFGEDGAYIGQEGTQGKGGG